MSEASQHERRRPTTTPPSTHSAGANGFWLDVIEDIRAVRRADPAARTPVEVILTYPGLHAIWFHRVAHGLWNKGHIVAARLLSHLSRHYTGIEIHPGATIGRRVFIDHGMGIVIGETAVIGDDCLIYKGVVLGGTTLKRTKRHPTLGKGVTVGSNACILGAVEIGDGARIGSGSVVIKDVEEGATVVGIPGRVVSKDRPSGLTIPNLDHAALPDPLQRIVKDLLGHIDRLSSRIHTLENLLELSPEELAEKLERHEMQDDLDLEFLAAYENEGAEANEALTEAEG
ncbi:serine O-acetyltransferase [Persicimonas caeni]|uniref:Serine acetyltransferase n=1 Tax=Persicimonas caeni TaxID=2292766 RepID=A0A4Y6PYZ1_PERCE|nr:serine O-acetyltransferase [Persicimonas caeni]QDG53379.1 serine O-acetyltransferase [Persicimonas caeni]QED34600.1 serine O-acetyltransferase [Persicimonas caeni]